MSLIDIHVHVSSPTSYFDCVQCITALLTMLIAGAALSLSLVEYYKYRKREKSELLNKYNERYSDNPVIQKVVKSLLVKAFPQEFSQIEIDRVSSTDIEFFLRFFEEIQQSINAGSLDKDSVRETLAFYALLAYEDRRIKNYIDQEPGNWKLFVSFIRTMNNVKPLSKEDKGNINDY